MKSIAPEAKALEHGGIPGRFRHPTDGALRQHWVSQPARPFLHPALVEDSPAAVGLAKKAVEKVLNEIPDHD